MQACLPVHAKCLRVAKKSTIVRSNSSENMTQACLPHMNQTDYYKGSSINGNSLYYALKAMEIDTNRTNSVVTEADDNTLIANISDPSRYSPAGLKRANKVVCAKLLQEMDGETKLFSKTALCPWEYICDYRADRFPNYLFKARCKTARCTGDCRKDKDINDHNMCQSHGVHVTVLQMRSNCKEWVWGQELLTIACTCTSDIGLMKAV